MEEDLHLFEYIFVDNKAAKTLFLLHGTGGSESDFLFLDEMLKKEYNLVGIGGNVSENGYRRFFKRFSEGVFDQESIKEETDKLAKFVKAWLKIHEVSTQDVVFLGYSNGATMLLSCVFYFPSVFTRLVLLHPMLPFAPDFTNLDLSQVSAFVSAGQRDTIVSPDNQRSVVENLRIGKSQVVLHEYTSGHEISPQEIAEFVEFLLSS